MKRKNSDPKRSWINRDTLIVSGVICLSSFAFIPAPVGEGIRANIVWGVKFAGAVAIVIGVSFALMGAIIATIFALSSGLDYVEERYNINKERVLLRAAFLIILILGLIGTGLSLLGAVS